MNDTNIIKKTCKILNITQRELAERIGISEGGLRTASSSGKITAQVEKACELLLKNNELEKELSEFKELQKALKRVIL